MSRERIVALIRAWGPPAAWFLGISLLSAQPGLRVSDDAAVDLPLRRLAHLAVFGILALLVLRALGGAGAPGTGRRAAAALVIAALLGGVDELHQSFVPDRTGRLADVALDAVGAAIALGAVLAASAFRGRLRRGSRPPGR